MNSSDRTYWCIAAGDELRDYSKEFLRFGIMLVGPRDYGKYDDNPEAYLKKDRVRKFVEQVKPGHVAILKRGAQRGSIIAAGIVDGARGWIDDERNDGYFWSEIFGNVQGFNLQHGRYVTWHQPKDEIPINGLPRGTLVHPHNPDIQREAERIIKDNDPITPEKISPPATPVKDEELIRHLIEHGLSSGQARM